MRSVPVVFVQWGRPALTDKGDAETKDFLWSGHKSVQTTTRILLRIDPNNHTSTNTMICRSIYLWPAPMRTGINTTHKLPQSLGGVDDDADRLVSYASEGQTRGGRNDLLTMMMIATKTTTFSEDSVQRTQRFLFVAFWGG